ncbi:antirestriction protein ArdA [Staphylococcus pseudintermedius]|nr:antirestriction protein ArdA [Staphylococcus pseudintermedius]
MENQNTNNTQNNIQLNLFISDLAEYNAGNLFGKWFNALTEFEAMSAYIDAIASKGNEWFISDYESDLFNISEFHSIEELQTMANRVSYVNNHTGIDVEIAKEIKDMFDDENERINACFYSVTLSSKFYSDNYKKALGLWYFENILEPELKATGIEPPYVEELTIYFDAEAKGHDLLLNAEYRYIGLNQKNAHIFTMSF